MKLTKSYYQQEDVVALSKDLLGKVIYTRFDGVLTSGIITETEAYAGITDKASHAYGGRRTKRTETMFARGGLAYVYLCYGIHHLFNVVTNQKDAPHAVLIRGMLPMDGMETILERRNKTKLDKKTAAGPGTLSQALGIRTKHNGLDLAGNTIWIEDEGIQPKENQVKITPRIGIDYADEDAQLPYRFVWDK